MSEACGIRVAHGRWMLSRVNGLLLVLPALVLAAAARPVRRGTLTGQVVVITGASSGIGRATALALASRGCRLVLAARRAALLEGVAAECRARGADAVAVPTDVTREADVVALRDRALERWGRIDVWVNNAGITMYARIEEGSFREHQRVIETNVFGPFHAARAVVPVFRRQHAGVLINVASVLGKIGQPFVPSYVVSKFALRGLSEALRVDLADEPDIHVCTILPYAVDTPHFEYGGNVIGRQPHAMPPCQLPEDVAHAIVAIAERPRRERHVPRLAEAGLMLHELCPRPIERLLRRALVRFHFGGTQEPTEGGLFSPCGDDGPIRGHRPPLVTKSRFTFWAIGELVRILAGRPFRERDVASRPIDADGFVRQRT